MRLTRKAKRIGLFVAIAHNLLLVALACLVWAPAAQRIPAGLRAICFYIFSWDLLIQIVAGSMLFTGLLFKLAFDTIRSFHWWTEEERYWQYVIVVILLSQFFQIIPTIMFLVAAYRGNHDTSAAEHLFVRIEIVAALLILGICVYLIKVWSKAIFGMAEIAVALISNSALIRSLDLSGFPRVKISGTQALTIGALTYLLSKGISNALEGLEDMRKKRESAVVSATEA